MYVKNVVIREKVKKSVISQVRKFYLVYIHVAMI